jgi:hypothetical protein
MRGDSIELTLRDLPDAQQCGEGEGQGGNALGKLPKISASYAKGELS